MRINEISADIRTAPQGYTLVSAFSDDLNCNVGMPKIMNEMFNITERVDVVKRYKNAKNIAKLDNLFLLLVKDTSYDAPIWNRLIDALAELRDKCEKNGIKKLAMPKICTSAEGFDWDSVCDEIMNTFMLSDIDIVVYCR